MSFFQYKDFTPKLLGDNFIAPDAVIIGQVTLGKKCNVWFKTVIRGDVNFITIGENTNVQDLSMLHVTSPLPLIIGSNTSIGHNVVLHACKIGNNCLIGMGAIILDGAEIGDYSLVAAGSLVPPNKKFPPKSFIVGNPAVVKRELSPHELIQYGNHYDSYLKYNETYLDPKQFKKIDLE